MAWLFTVANNLAIDTKRNDGYLTDLDEHTWKEIEESRSGTQIDPEKLISYGLSIGQLEQQVANNNTNGGGSFIEQGSQQINVQSMGLYTDVQDIQDTGVKTQNGAAIAIEDIASALRNSGRIWFMASLSSDESLGRTSPLRILAIEPGT